MTRQRSPKDRPEHRKNAYPSNKEPHESGQRRRRMAQGKDKKRQEKDWFQR